MRLLGIDPGKDGGLALLVDRAIEKLAVMPVIKGAKTKKLFDLPTLRNFVIAWQPDLVAIEKQQALPAKLGGGSANYSRGYALGMLEMLAACQGFRYALIAPRSWQSDVLRDTNTTDTKQAALVVAQRLWPNQKWTMTDLARKPHDGVIDACLIAEFARRRGL